MNRRMKGDFYLRFVKRDHDTRRKKHCVYFLLSFFLNLSFLYRFYET